MRLIFDLQIVGFIIAVGFVMSYAPIIVVMDGNKSNNFILFI